MLACLEQRRHQFDVTLGMHISLTTAKKWVCRYRAAGPARPLDPSGLLALSHRQFSDGMRAQIVKPCRQRRTAPPFAPPQPSTMMAHSESKEDRGLIADSMADRFNLLYRE
jgi:hypothetical protein